MLLPAECLDQIDGFTIKLGRKHYYFRGGETPFNDNCSANIAINKYCTNKVLELAKIPVPKLTGIYLYEFEEGKLEERVADFKFPLVIKPLDDSYGSGVICNIKNIDELKYHLQHAFALYEVMLIEEYHANLKSYRVLVFNRKIVGLILRYPAFVVGDGEHTIEQLIPLANSQRQKVNDALGNIVVDEECQMRLKEQNLSLAYVPQPKERVYLGYTSNASRGGSYETVRMQICKKNRRLIVRAAEILNLNLVGFDVECSDMSLPIEDSQGVIIEANHRPSIRIHEIPMSGAAKPVVNKIMRSLIYKHPLAYLHVLYTNRKTKLFVRSLILAAIFSLLYKLLV